MHANHCKSNNTTVPAAPGTEQSPHKKMRLTFVTDGTWFDLQVDRNEETGFNLHLATDGDCGELTIQSDDGDEAYSGLRVYRDRSA